MLVFAYLRDGGIYRDHDSWEEGDRLGRYVVVLGREGKHAETSSPIGGKMYRSLWLWSEKDEEEERDYGTVPLILMEE